MFFSVKWIGVTNWLLWFDEKKKCAGNNFDRSCKRKRKSKLTAARLKYCGNFFCQITTPSNYYDFVLFSRLQLLPPVSAAASGHFDAPPASPLWSFCGTPVPTPVWQCFQLGCRIRFLLPNTETPWQKAEVLALKDHEAMKIDSRNSYQYAPNGLVLVQVRNVYTVDRQ